MAEKTYTAGPITLSRGPKYKGSAIVLTKEKEQLTLTQPQVRDVIHLLQMAVIDD